MSKKKKKSLIWCETLEELSLIDLSLEQLVESDFHLGSRFNQFDRLSFIYIFSCRFDVSIINLSYSLYNLKLAIYFMSTMVSRRGKVLFYDGAEHTYSFISFIGLTSKQYFISHKWIAGLLTNFKEFYPAVFFGVSRHFRFPVIRFSGMQYIHRPPNVFCMLNITRNSAAFFETFRLGIPTIALISSENSVAGVTFPIFANNLSPNTYITFLSILRAAILNGYKYEVYKFYRRTIKNIIKLRYIRYFFSKRRRLAHLAIYFRIFILKILFDHSYLIWRFLRFCLYPFCSSLFREYLSLKTQSLFSEFYEAFPFLRSIFLNFATDFFFPVLDSIFSSNFLLLKNSKFKKISRSVFLQKFYLNFTSKERFCNFLAKFLDYLSYNFFSTNFFIFVDLFLARFIPLILFLFKMFLALEEDLEIKKLRSFFMSLKIFFLCFCLSKAPNILKYAKEFVKLPSSSLLSTHIIHENFSFFQYKIQKFPDLRSMHFSKILTFRFSHLPVFSGFNYYSLGDLGNLVSIFKKGYGFFRYFKFSKYCKRSFRRFFRSFKFIRFLFRNVYKKLKATTIIYDLKINKFLKIKQGSFLAKKIYRFFKQKGQKRYINVFYTIQTFTKKQISSMNWTLFKRYNSYLLAFFDEEFDDLRFPVNDEFFQFQVGYGSAYLTRQFQRNRILERKRANVKKGFDMKKKILINHLKKKHILFRVRFYYYFVLQTYFLSKKKKPKK